MTTMMTTNDDKGNDGHSDDNDENGEDDLVRQFHTRAPPKQAGHRCDDRALLSQGFRCSTEQIEMIYLLKSWWFWLWPQEIMMILSITSRNHDLVQDELSSHCTCETLPWAASM